MWVYYFARAAVPQPGTLKKHKCIVSQLWRLEGQDQSVCRVGPFQGL